MNPHTPNLVLCHHDADGMQQLREQLLVVYAEVYSELMQDPFFAPERFWQRLEAYAKWPGFALVVGKVGGELIGYTLGYRLPKHSAWWRGFQGDVEPDLLEEDGERTFAITQLMVLPAWQRRGYAKQLHDALLLDRPEERATLLVKPSNIPARTAYLSWNWRRFGQLKPFEDAPVYESLIFDLAHRA